MKIMHTGFSKDKIAFALLCIYAFVVPLGTVFRFGTEEGSLGISTILLLSLVTLYILYTIPLLFKKKVFFVLLLLVLWFSFSTLFTPDSIISGYKTLISLIIYIFLAITITRIDLPAKRLKIFFFCLTVGIFLSSGLTLIDFLGVVDVPYANELNRSTHVAGGNVIQASGFFPRRSAMAAYIALVLPALIPLVVNLQNTILKTITATTYLVSLLCLVATYFSDVVQVYLFRLSVPSSMAGISDDQLARQKESDNMRLYFLSQAVGSLAKNPIGYGFTQIWTERYGLTDPHNIITQVIWGAGLFSFVWLGLFGYLMIKLFVLKISPHNDLFVYFDALKYCLLSWFITGMAHTILCIGLAWIFLGMMLNIRARCLGTSQLRKKFIKQEKLPVAF